MRTALFASLALTLPASAANILVLSSGDAATDNAALAVLRARGHRCTLGAPYYQQSFTAQSLSPYQTVYLQANNNWYLGEISASAGLNLRTWVQGGGRLVTSEWVTYYSTPATTYYTTPGIYAGLVGWSRGSGSVYSFSTTCGPTELTVSQDFAQLLSNVMGPVAACYANCDQSTGAPILNVNDFSCFLSHFASGDSYANCDQSTSLPVLNVNDFTCFTARFAAGCP